MSNCAPIQADNQASLSRDHSSPANQITSHLFNVSITSNTRQHEHYEALSVSVGLFTYAFLLPLVANYLNDGDVVARLLIVNKLIRRKIPKYAFKRRCAHEAALKIIQASRDIVFSVGQVYASHYAKLQELFRLHQVNHVELDEVQFVMKNGLSSDIPHFVTNLHIYCSDESTEPIILSAGLIPDSVMKLDLSFSCDFVMKPDSIPPSVKSMTMFVKLDQFDAAMIPHTVTDLYLRESGDSPPGALRGPFPALLKRLDLCGHHLPFAAGVIPFSVTRLECDSKLLSVLETGVIPNSVTRVKLIWKEDCVLKPGMLPDSVTSLVVESHVRTCFIPQSIPKRLTHLRIYARCGMTISVGILPATLTHFECYSVVEPGALPDGVTHVRLDSIRHGVLPQSVTHLTLRSIHSDVTPGLIPSSVTHLEIRCGSQQQMIPGVIPDSVTHLAFGYGFTRPLTPGFIPQSVTHLMLDANFNHPLSCHSLPRNLTQLCFGDKFNQSIVHLIPHTVTYLVFGRHFNQPILPGDIPPSVTHLAFGDSFFYMLDSSNLPSSLTHLEIPRGYLKSDDRLWLPPSVTHISYKSKRSYLRPEMSWNNWSVEEDVD